MLDPQQIKQELAALQSERHVVNERIRSLEGRGRGRGGFRGRGIPHPTNNFQPRPSVEYGANDYIPEPRARFLDRDRHDRGPQFPVSNLDALLASLPLPGACLLISCCFEPMSAGEGAGICVATVAATIAAAAQGDVLCGGPPRR
jgi:hypothetical protein